MIFLMRESSHGERFVFANVRKYGGKELILEGKKFRYKSSSSSVIRP